MKKNFDCVEMKRQAGARIYETVKDMTQEEELAYWKRRSEELHSRRQNPHTLNVVQEAKLILEQ